MNKYVISYDIGIAGEVVAESRAEARRKAEAFISFKVDKRVIKNISVFEQSDVIEKFVKLDKERKR